MRPETSDNSPGESQNGRRPLLFCDVDGVISLFGFQQSYGLGSGNAPFTGCPGGEFHSVNGIIHAWAAERPGPALLIETERHVGMHEEHVEHLLGFAQRLEPPR